MVKTCMGDYNRHVNLFISISWWRVVVATRAGFDQKWQAAAKS
ncbi:MAG: hypothetical protein QXV37_01200 [Candidatus Jordarchaeaceae archaeon]